MNTIEELLQKRKLPELLRFANGESVTRENWETRRKELVDILCREVYGYAPPAPAHVVVTETKRKDKDYAGKGTVRNLTLSFPTDKGEFSFPVVEVVPTDAGNCPVFVHVNFRPDVPDRYLPIEEILDAGCGVIRIYYNDIAFDGEDGFTGGLAAMYDRKKYTWGKIRMWAFAASRVMDYLQTVDYADKNRIAVVGHSRLGKTALVTAATDPRFAMACANDSGCTGDALSRDKVGESVKAINGKFPYWFCDTYRQYGDREHEMPFDQHFLVAAIAPRRVALGSAVEDTWADPDSQYLSACAASAAWELLGEKGFVHPDRLPVPGDCFDAGSVAFHLREGTHFFSRTDWHRYLCLI
ncbi:MAG: acetylxylan esterase [Clostridia bacterium]|nr:acetylxylan esterase [Clostridia bacterium]